MHANLLMSCHAMPKTHTHTIAINDTDGYGYGSQFDVSKVSFSPVNMHVLYRIELNIHLAHALKSDFILSASKTHRLLYFEYGVNPLRA